MDFLEKLLGFVLQNPVLTVLVLLLILAIIVWLIIWIYSLKKGSYAPVSVDPSNVSFPAEHIPQVVQSKPIHFKSVWELYIYLLKKYKWVVLGIPIFAALVIYWFFSIQMPIYEATTRIMVHQKPGVKFVPNTYQAEQASNTMSTALVQIVLTKDFENKVLDQLLEKNAGLYPINLLEELSGSGWLGIILNKNGVIDGNYIKRLPVITIFSIGEDPNQALALGELSSKQLIKEAREIYGGVESVDLRVIDNTKTTGEPIFPQTKKTVLFIFVLMLVVELFIMYILAESKHYHH